MPELRDSRSDEFSDERRVERDALLDYVRRVELEREHLAAEADAWKRVAATRAAEIVRLRESAGQAFAEREIA